MRVASVLVLAALSPAVAQAAEAIDDNDWTLALHQGPVIGSARVLGLGGSFVGVAEGAEGLLYNPASLSNRSSRSQDWYEWDATVDWLFLGSFGEVDFFHDGPEEARFSSFSAGLFGGSLQFGRFGIGTAWRFQSCEAEPAEEGADTLSPVDLRTLSGTVAIAWSFDWLGDEALALGAGVRVASLDARVLTEPPAERVTLLTGSSLQTGALWRPPGRPWRLGAALRLPTRGSREEAAAAREATGPLATRIEGRWLPDEIEAPWELAVGFSWMFGPFAPSYNSLRSAVRVPVPGGRRLVTVDTVLTGAVEHAKEGGRATGLSGFVGQKLFPSRTTPSLSVRLGVEDDLLPTRLRVRGGAYVEPARFEGVGARPHLTGGFDLRLFEIWGYNLRLSAVFDVAERYNNVAVSLGLWHWPMATR